MLLYYLWPAAEKMLGYLPFGKTIYGTVGFLRHRTSRGASDNVSGFPLARKARELVPPGGVVMDVGTGWFHLVAFLLWLVGDYKVYLFDVADKGKLTYIRNYLQHLHDNIDLLVQELDIDRDVSLLKLEELLRMRTREEIYEACNFELCITENTDTPFLPENSVDLMVSTCVLNHIPAEVLLPELVAMHQILKPGGRMYHLLGHQDHWTYHDKSANQFNFYRYSDRWYSKLFDTKFEFQNRLVIHEWLDLFKQCGFDVEEYDMDITDESRQQIAELPHIDARFAKFPREDLASAYTYVLVRGKDQTKESSRSQGRVVESIMMSTPQHSGSADLVDAAASSEAVTAFRGATTPPTKAMETTPRQQGG